MPYYDDRELNFSKEPGWARGGSDGCNAYGADKSISPYGYNTVVGSTFLCTARDFARIGYLWLRKGQWRDRQLVSKEWIEQATRRHGLDNGESPMNYGYTFWALDDLSIPNDAFMSRGRNLNDCYVVPSLDLVVVRQGNENHVGEDWAVFRVELLKKLIDSLP